MSGTIEHSIAEFLEAARTAARLAPSSIASYRRDLERFARWCRAADLDDPESIVAEFETSPRAFRLLEDVGTHPKVIYLREG